jgi:hypothetical protein
MKFPRWFSRDAADPVALAERVARAIANADMRELKKLVWRDVVFGTGRAVEQLPGRDGFLQFVNSLRRDPKIFRVHDVMHEKRCKPVH